MCGCVRGDACMCVCAGARARVCRYFWSTCIVPVSRMLGELFWLFQRGLPSLCMHVCGCVWVCMRTRVRECVFVSVCVCART